MRRMGFRTPALRRPSASSARTTANSATSGSPSSTGPAVSSPSPYALFLTTATIGRPPASCATACTFWASAPRSTSSHGSKPALGARGGEIEFVPISAAATPRGVSAAAAVAATKERRDRERSLVSSEGGMPPNDHESALPARVNLRPKAERSVYPANEREQRRVLAREHRRQCLARHLGICERSAARERLITEPLRRGVILREATWHAFECRVVVNPAESPWEGECHALELLWLLGDCVAQTIQLRPRRHPNARAQHGLAAGLEMEVETRTSLIAITSHAPAGATMMEPAGRVRLVR